MGRKKKTTEEQVTFNDVPVVLNRVLISLEKLTTKVSELEITATGDSKWMDVDDLIAYLPFEPAKKTIYRWMQDGLIPFYRSSKTAYFLKPDIDKWLKDDTSVACRWNGMTAEEYVKNNPIDK